MPTQNHLKKSDLNRIESEAQLRIEYELGDPPTLASEGGRDRLTGLAEVQRWIEGLGAVVTTLVGEFLQAFGVILLAVGFVVLEVWRVYAGAKSIGQTETASVILAIALVGANLIHPIYTLRAHKAAGKVTRIRRTGRYIVNRLKGALIDEGGEVVEYDEDFNALLGIAALLVTVGTLGFAIIDLLPFEGVSSWSEFGGKFATPLDAVVVIVGVFVSGGGVFFLQAVAHEIGVRTLSDRGQTSQERLDAARTEYRQRRAEILDEVTRDYILRMEEPDTLAETMPIFTHHNGNGHKSDFTEEDR